MNPARGDLYALRCDRCDQSMHTHKVRVDAVFRTTSPWGPDGLSVLLTFLDERGGGMLTPWDPDFFTLETV